MSSKVDKAEDETERPMEYKPLYVDRKLIRPNTFNPRTEFDRDAMGNLVQSIAIQGVKTPIQLRPIPEDELGRIYEVVDGDRRLAAAEKAKIAKVPVWIEQKSEEEVREYGLIANVFRRELSPVEQGQALLELKEQDKYKFMNQRDMVIKLGFSPSKATKLIALATRLPEEVQELVAPEDSKSIPKGSIDSFVAYDIAKIPDKERKIEVGKELAASDLRGIKARAVVRRAREHPEESVTMIISKVEQTTDDIRPTITMTAEDYEKIKQGKKWTIIERSVNVKPGIKADAEVIPLVRTNSLKISDIYKRSLARFTDMDAERDGYQNLEEFKQSWIEKHGEWVEEEVVSIIQFQKE